jgi:hypothetical protein
LQPLLPIRDQGRPAMDGMGCQSLLKRRWPAGRGHRPHLLLKFLRVKISNLSVFSHFIE